MIKTANLNLEFRFQFQRVIYIIGDTHFPHRNNVIGGVLAHKIIFNIQTFKQCIIFFKHRVLSRTIQLPVVK